MGLTENVVKAPRPWRN